MIKRLLSLVVIAAVLTACGNKSKNPAESPAAAITENGKVEFAKLVEHPGEYIGKTIAVEGKVVHVCTHSGKKLFIVGENPDVRLYIQAGENMPKFPMDLLGSTVEVEGTLTKVGGTAMAEGGAQLAGGEMKHEGAAAADTCETATALAAQTVLADVMMEYKSHIVK